jgi:hypothetical protein
VIRYFVAVKDIRLLRTKRNEVFAIVDNYHLTHLDLLLVDARFEESTEHGLLQYHGSEVVHNQSGFFYRFGKVYDVYTPAEPERTVLFRFDDLGDYSQWERRKQHVAKWLNWLKGEVDTPDLWSEVAKTKSLATATAIIPPEERFNKEETLYIAESLKRIEAGIADQHQLTASQTEAIHDGFEEIKVEMNRFGKKDWVNNATGLLFNIMVGSALAPSAARDLYNMFVAAVAPLLDVAHKLIS